MQVTYNPNLELEVKEFFTGGGFAELETKMDHRLHELEAQGHTLVKRQKVGRNETCPCGSGAKFKKCCLSKAA